MITALYCRLSRDDELQGDNFPNPRYFVGDGYSGTNFDRPAYQEMMELVEDGMVEAIIVKDHSRLGRNRLVIGQLLEEILEEHNVRYIAVTDNIASLKGLDDMVAVRDLFNEWYARDTSKKIRAVVLEKLVLEHLQGTVQYVRECENKFVQSMGKKSAADRRKEISAKRRGCHRPSGAWRNWTGFSSGSMRTMFPGKSLTNDLQNCPTGMKPNRKSCKQRLLFYKRN